MTMHAHVPPRTSAAATATARATATITTTATTNQRNFNSNSNININKSRSWHLSIIRYKNSPQVIGITGGTSSKWNASMRIRALTNQERFEKWTKEIYYQIEKEMFLLKNITHFYLYKEHRSNIQIIIHTILIKQTLFYFRISNSIPRFPVDVVSPPIKHEQPS